MEPLHHDNMDEMLISEVLDSLDVTTNHNASSPCDIPYHDGGGGGRNHFAEHCGQMFSGDRLISTASVEMTGSRVVPLHCDTDDLDNELPLSSLIYYSTVDLTESNRLGVCIDILKVFI